MASKSSKSQYEILGIFLILELVALISFGLGGVNMVLHYAGFIVALVAFYFAIRNFSKEDLIPVLLIGIPLVLLSIFVSFGKYFESVSFIENFAVFLAIPAFFGVGLCYRRIETHSTRNLILCIGAGLALVTLIGMFATWVQYGFFYPLIYKDTPAYYYNGNLYSITAEMNWLVGFRIIEVSQKFGGLFGLMCACFLCGLLFVDRKKDLMLFIIFAVVGGVGLLSLITVPNFPALIIAAIVYIVALFYRFLRKNELATKIVSYTIFIGAGVLAVVVLFAILNVAVPAINEVTKNNAFLNRLFNSNKYMVVANPIIEAALKPFNLFGIDALQYHSGYKISEKVILSNAGSFEVEVLREGGIFAFIFLLAIIVASYISFANYLKKSNDKDYVKVIFLALIVGMFVYLTFNSDVYPDIHEPSSYKPFTRSLPFMLMLFIIGFTLLPRGKSDIEYKDEVVSKENTRKNIDEDYEFNDVVEEDIL